MQKIFKNRLGNFSVCALVFLIMISWIFSGWPRIWNNPQIPPESQEAMAVTCGFGAEIGETGVCRGFLTTTGSNQTWTSPSDWNNEDNTIEAIGAGGSGGAIGKNSSNVATGGGGGAYSLISNFEVATPGTTQATYRIGAGGTGVNGTLAAGNVGEDTWFNDSSFPGAGADNTKCGAKGGSGGAAGAAAQSGGTGGVDTAGWGETRRSGGSGGNASHTSNGTGGGGAAGNSSTGGDGVDSSGVGSATNGGQANGSGAAGGAANTNGSGAAGGDGTEYTTEGSGGGGGGGRDSVNSTIYGGNGGSRGGGGGGVTNYRTSGVPRGQGGNGGNGIIVITYTPANQSPSLTVSQPDGADDTVTVGDSYNITYTLTDAEDDAVVDFYYDSDDSGLDGDAIADCQDQAEGTGATCSWDTTGMTPGDYYVYGIATDGVNPDENDYSPGQITIEGGGGNNDPTVSSISLNGGDDINLTEGTFKWASSTMTVADDDGCDTISSVVAKLYRTATSTGGTTCSQDDLNCYIGIGSTTVQNNCLATTTGNICEGGVDTSAQYDCGFKIWYVADPTDLGTYAGHVWAVAATTTDSEAATGTATNTAETIEIISLNALSVTSSIDFGSLNPDTDTDTSNEETTVTTTGNTAIDTEVSGTDMTGAGTITVGNQKYDTTDQTYDSLTSTLTGSAVTQELDNVKPTATTSPQTDIVYWGLNVPAGTPQGSYSGTNTFGAVSD